MNQSQDQLDDQKLRQKMKDFLLGQLNLYSNLCYGRNYHCRNIIKSKLPFKVVLNYIWDEELCQDIRASFISIIDNVYIDMKPRLARKVPLLIYDIQERY